MLTPEIKENHQNLSKAALQYLEYAHDKIEEHSGLDPPFPLQPWPTFVSTASLEPLRKAAVRIPHLIKTIPERIFQNDPKKISAFYGLENEFVARILLEPPNGIADAFCRGDFVYASNGFKCVEANIGANIGGWQTKIWEPLYLENPHIKSFLHERGLQPQGQDTVRTMLAHIVKRSLNQGHGHSGILNAALIFSDFQSNQGMAAYLNEVYQRVLVEAQPGLTGKVVCHASLTGLKVERTRVYCAGTRVDLVVNCLDQTVSEQVFRAFKAGHILLYGGPGEWLLNDKRNLALLSRNQNTGIFQEEEQEIIRDHVPWTRELLPGETTYRAERLQLPEAILAHPEKWIIKPARGMQGQDVCIGRETAAHQWERQVGEAVARGNWLVQEYLESRTFLYRQGPTCRPHRLIWGMFSFGQFYGGGFLRMMPRDNGSVINSYQGATEGILFEV